MTPALLAGCGAGGDLISTVALPTRQSPDFVEGGGVEGVGVEGAGADGVRETASSGGALRLTEPQRGFLDDLAAAGIRPSSDLRALSIGSYICQARAARQSDTSVREYVAPMIRSDVADSRAAAPQTPGAEPGGVQFEAAVTEYIRSATKRLC